MPNLSVSGGMDYVGSGQSNFGQGFTRATSAQIGSSYSAGFSWQIDGGRIVGPKQQRANRRAVDDEIQSEGNNLQFSVTNQYLTTLQATAQVAVARQQVERNQAFLDLARAKYQVGQGTLIEVRQAEVQKAQSEVALLRNVQTEDEAKLELFRLMGTTPPDGQLSEVVLSDSFPVEEPHFELNELLTLATEQNPALRALDSRRRAASVGVTAKTAYLPSLSLRGGWSGFTQQQTDNGLLIQQSLLGAQGSAAGCIYQDSIRTALGFPGVVGTTGCYTSAGLDPTGTSLDPRVRSQIESANNKFPFSFTKQPFSASLTISLPLFTGFGRSLALQQAREVEQDADESVRAEGLQLRTDVQGRWLGLDAAYRAIGVQSASRDAARDRLRLAQDRYRLGSGTALEVSDAQNAVQQAEGDYVNAIYAYHKSLAALEAAVGRPLR
jgi:outer membrane protein TolC